MYVTLPVLLPLLDCKHFKELSINQLTKCSDHSSRTNLLKMLSQYVTLLLEMLQWLHMALGVKAKNPVMVYKVLCGPLYLCDLPSYHSDFCSLHSRHMAFLPDHKHIKHTLASGTLH